jgi:hypothetical protein
LYCGHPAPPSPSEAILAALSSGLCSILHTDFREFLPSTHFVNKGKRKGRAALDPLPLRLGDATC